MGKLLQKVVRARAVRDGKKWGFVMDDGTYLVRHRKSHNMWVNEGEVWNVRVTHKTRDGEYVCIPENRVGTW